MTTRERLDLLAHAYPRLFPRAALMRLLRQELGSVDALDRWIQRDGVCVRARAPKTIYHICAGNLAVSACTSLAHGLLLGADNVMKLPGQREGSKTASEILAFVQGLPRPLRRQVQTHREIDEALLAQAGVIVAFGSDATMENLRARTRWNQTFIAHGHAVSLLWIAEPDRLTPRQARACAIDVLTYDQLGCLSPQAIYFPAGVNIEVLGTQLARALETEWQRNSHQPARPLSVAARIHEARDVAQALGHSVWLPPKKHLGWTVIHDPNPTFQPSPLHGVIYLRATNEGRLRTALAPVSGRLSTIGLVGKTSSRLQRLFLSLGVSRFCPAGRMQFPPSTWHHDGHAPLRGMVTWIDAESAA